MAHEIVTHVLLLLQMVPQRKNNLFQRPNSFIRQILDGLDFCFGSILAFLLDHDGFAEDTILLDDALVVRL